MRKSGAACYEFFVTAPACKAAGASSAGKDHGPATLYLSRISAAGAQCTPAKVLPSILGIISRFII
jgi:hypothetical protein